MSVTVQQIADLVASTQQDLGPMKWTDIASELQDHVGMKQLLRKERVGYDSGQYIEWNVVVKHSGAARMVQLHAEDQVVIKDVIKKANAPWRHTTTNYGFERREVLINRSPAKIVDLVSIRRNDALTSLAELVEAQCWQSPSSSADEDNIFGVPYWLQYNATEGFNGGNPAGFSAGAGGLDSNTYGQWSNWTAQYAAVTQADLIRKWRKASRYTGFKAPVPHPSYNRGDRHGYYTNYTVVGALEEALEGQNSNLGNDIASKDGAVVFRRREVTWVPYLDSFTNDPVFGINWGVFRPVFLKGDYLHEEPPEKVSGQHNDIAVHVDLTWNFECRDRRRNFCLATGAFA